MTRRMRGYDKMGDLVDAAISSEDIPTTLDQELRHWLPGYVVDGVEVHEMYQEKLQEYEEDSGVDDAVRGAATVVVSYAFKRAVSQQEMYERWEARLHE